MRPRDLPQAAKAVEIPYPEHAHLPGWVKRVHGQASPIFSDILAQIDDPERSAVLERIQKTVEQISAGKFSQAWQYPAIIEQGSQAWARGRNARLQEEQAHRALDNKRKQLTAAVRDPLSRLSNEATSRLSKALTSARDPEAFSAVAGEIERALEAAKNTAEKRRDREIERTRDRISKAVPKSKTAAKTQESWQDVLKRLTADSGTPTP